MLRLLQAKKPLRVYINPDQPKPINLNFMHITPSLANTISLFIDTKAFDMLFPVYSTDGSREFRCHYYTKGGMRLAKTTGSYRPFDNLLHMLDELERGGCPSTTREELKNSPFIQKEL